MKTIRKYKLTFFDAEEQEIEMPLNSEILSVQLRGNEPYLWAMVNSEEPIVVRKILVIRTGNPVATIFNYKFIGTVQCYKSNSTFHFFDAEYKAESK